MKKYKKFRKITWKIYLTPIHRYRYHPIKNPSTFDSSATTKVLKNCKTNQDCNNPFPKPTFTSKAPNDDDNHAVSSSNHLNTLWHRQKKKIKTTQKIRSHRSKKKRKKNYPTRSCRHAPPREYGNIRPEAWLGYFEPLPAVVVVS